MPDQSVGDTLTLSDGSVINNSLHAPSFNDTLSLLDAILLAVPTQEILYDILALSDSVRFSTSGLGLTLKDNFNLSDSIQTSHTQNTLLSDTISISDVLSAVLNLILGVSDSLSISDALLANLAFGVSDGLSISDDIVNLAIPTFLANSQLVSDTLGL